MAKENRESKNWKKYRCLVARQPGGSLYTIVIRGKELAEKSRVLSRALDPKGIQRLKVDARCKRIAKFYALPDALMPGNVIGNMSSEQFQYNNEEGVASINQDFMNEIVDGQTRTWGFSPEFNEANVDFDLILTFMVDASDRLRAVQFYKINKEQKKVNPSLAFDLLEVMDEDTEEAIIAKISKILNEESDSPFRGLVGIKETDNGRISLATMVDKTKKFLGTPIGRKFRKEGEISENSLKETLKNYFNAVKKEFPEEWDNPDCILVKTLGFGGLIELLPDVLTEFINKKGYRIPTVAEMEEILEPMSSFDFNDQIVSSLGGEKGQKTLADKMREDLGFGTF